ncbi:hypothetical protein, partial [Rhizobium leguminosarum]|uniref:hypothetical protein n=1 Tax=Rhizobium leguminosarum TaxID=384 RepID=UPI003F9BF6E6
CTEFLDSQVGVERLLLDFVDTLLQPAACAASGIIFRVQFVDKMDVASIGRSYALSISYT